MGVRGQKEQEELGRIASTSQIQSLDILTQWWSGKLRSPLKTEQLQDALEKAQIQAEGYPIDDSSPRTIKVANHRVALPVDPECGESKYAHDLLILWLHEFYFGEKDIDDEFIFNLEKTRSSAQSLTVSHRLTHAVFPTLVGGTPRPPRLPKTMTIGEPAFGAGTPCPWLDLRSDQLADETTRRKRYPYYLWDIPNQKTVETSSLQTLPGYWVLSHTWGRWRKNESGRNIACDMKNVPWPVPENHLFEVTELPNMLQKLTRTWPALGYAWIDLFCIPQEGAAPEFDPINKTEIAKQAEIFRMASWAVVWMNEVESWDGLKAAIEWLLLHYILEHVPLLDAGLLDSWAIFMEALRRGIPLNWDKPRVSSDESKASQIESSNDSTQQDEHPSTPISGFHSSDSELEDAVGDSEISQSHSITGLGYIFSVQDGLNSNSDRLYNFKGISKLAAIKPAPYLTGLWTFQEACLCHTLRLLNKHLDPLLMGTCSQEITLDTLCALLDVHNSQSFTIQPSGFGKDIELVNIKLTSELEEMPLGVMELIGALTATGLSRLLSISALDLLELGSRRWCPHSRGPAIMAAVGVTDWFEGQSVPHLKIEDPKDLVLGHYPLDFVQSVREKAGAIFFASQRERIRHIALPDLPQMNSLSLHGTMLRFYWGAYTGRWRPRDFQDHPSVASWTVNKNGSADVKDAGILLSTDRLTTALI
jgi:hypothetical protein